MPYEHFTQDERISLQGYLDKRMKCKDIAARLGKDPTSVSREVKRNRTSDGVRRGRERNCLRCANFEACDLEGLCGDTCLGRKCRSCMSVDATRVCPGHEPSACRTTTRFPYVCNGCRSRGACKWERFVYGAKVAQAKADRAASEPRRGYDLTGRQLGDIDSLVTPLVAQGQSLNAIYIAHSAEIPCELKTLYTMFNRGDIGPGRMHGVEMVCRKPRRRKKPKSGNRVPRKSLEGRSWEDFLALDEDVRDSRWEMDTVIGRPGGKCLLTLLHRLTRLQLALLLAGCTQAEVEAALDLLSGLRRSPFAPGSRTVVTTDNGGEFSDAEAIEADGRIRLYYCEPYSSWQKGAAERNHRIYRRIVPKGTSFDELSQADCALMMSHVNSLPREVLGGRSPLDLAVPFFGEEFLGALGVERLDPDSVVLLPSLLG